MADCHRIVYLKNCGSTGRVAVNRNPSDGLVKKKSGFIIINICHRYLACHLCCYIRDITRGRKGCPYDQLVVLFWFIVQSLRQSDISAFRIINFESFMWISTNYGICYTAFWTRAWRFDNENCGTFCSVFRQSLWITWAFKLHGRKWVTKHWYFNWNLVPLLFWPCVTKRQHEIYILLLIQGSELRSTP